MEYSPSNLLIFRPGDIIPISQGLADIASRLQKASILFFQPIGKPNVDQVPGWENLRRLMSINQ